MQKIATRVFIIASVAFGFFGICDALTLPKHNDNLASDLNILFMRLLFISGFVVLSSFALSVAGKYLNGGK